MSCILVVGGAGYVGSHSVSLLRHTGHRVVVLDNLSTGHWESVLGADLHVGDLSRVEDVEYVFSNYKFDAVMHFASSIEVAESVKHPSKYYRNNVANTLNLLDTMCKFNVKQLVFSSTAAVYGEPSSDRIQETHSKVPINPYGASKLMVEQILEHYHSAYGLRSVSLRYFNAAGAHPSGVLGEWHQPETHLLPLLLQVASGRRNDFSVFGRDHATPDGTCLRDLVHVMDLAKAHLLAMYYLQEGKEPRAFNLGTGAGYSVQEIIEVVREVTGQLVPVTYAARREGDPARLIANAEDAYHCLGWNPHFTITEIVKHAWVWEQKLNKLCT